MKQIIIGSLLVLGAISSTYSLAEEYVEDAKIHIQKGEYKSAIIQLKNQIKKKPYDSEARYLLGKLYLRSGELKLADKELSKAFELVPNDIKFTLAYARILLMRGEHQSVITILSKTSAKKKIETERLELLAEAYLGNKERAKAKELFEKLSNESENVAAYIGMAKVMVLEKNQQEVLRWLEKSLSVQPDNKEALRIKAKIYTFNLKFHEAKEIYARLIEKNKNNAEFYLERAIIEIAEQDLNSARNDIQHVLSQNNAHVYANYLISQVQLLNKNYTKAHESSQKVLNAASRHYPSMLISSVANLGLGNYNQAEKYVLQYLSNRPNETRAQNLLANIYIAQQNGEQAILIIEGIDPEKVNKEVGLLTTLGSAYLLIGEYKKGMSALSKASKLAPKNKFIKQKLISEQYKSGDFENVISGLENTVDFKSSNNKSNYMLVLAYIQKKDFQQAKINLEKFIKNSPENPTLYNLEAIVAILEGLTDKAIQAYQKAIKVDNKYIPAFMGMAKIELDRNNSEQAKKYYESILRIDNKYTRAYTGLARISEIQKDLKAVEMYLKDAYKENKGNARIQVELAIMLSKLYISQKRNSEIDELVDNLKRSYTDDKYVYGFFAMVYMLNKQDSEAIQVFYQLIKIDPKNTQQRMTLAALLTKKGKLTEALRAYDEVIALSPNNPTPVLKKGYIYLKEKEFKQLSELADAAEVQYPSLSVSKILLMEMALQEEQYDKAIEFFIQGYSRQQNLKHLYILVDTLRKIGKEYKAFQLLKKLLVVNNDDAGVHFKLASLYQINGKTDKAIQHYKIILEIDKKSLLALNNLAWLYTQQENPQGLFFAQQAYEISPESANVNDTYGYALYKFGDRNKALMILEKAAKQADKETGIQVHLAEVYLSLGRKNEARSILQTLLTNKKAFKERKQVEKMLLLL